MRSRIPRIDEGSRFCPLIKLVSAASIWIPAEDVLTHEGHRISKDSVFFSGPNKAIGKIVSAESNVNRLSPPLSGSVALGVPLGAFVVTVVSFAVGCHLTMNGPIRLGDGMHSRIPVRDAGADLDYYCSAQGETTVHVRGRKDRVYDRVNLFSEYRMKKLMLFRSCHEVFTSLVDSHINRLCWHELQYYWKNESGVVVDRLQGSYRKRLGGTPQTGELFFFATAAEQQWVLRCEAWKID